MVLLHGLDADPTLAREDLQLVVDKVQAALEDPYELGEIIYHGSASIGVKLIDGSGESDPDQILKDADAAMYIVKKRRP